MKQTISTIYPPIVKKDNNTCRSAKTPPTLNGFQRGSVAGRKPTPSPASLSSFFCYATSKIFEWHFADWPMVARYCGLAGIRSVYVLYRHLVALHSYAFFCKTFVRKNAHNYTTKQFMRCCYYCFIMRGYRDFIRRDSTKL